MPTTFAVEFENVTYRYPGTEASVLEGVSLRVAEGERLGVLGPNGGGKSTLLKLAMGLLEVQSGVIRVEGESPSAARRRGVVGYVPQKPDAEMSAPISVREMVVLGASWRVKGLARVSGEVRAYCDRMLELTGAGSYADRAVGKLSGGQFQRAMIARALACRPRILVLDEPTVGIDAAGQSVFAELLARVHGELGLTMLVVSHDLRAIAAGSDRVACLARRLHLHGSPSGLTPAVLAELFSHDIAGIIGTGAVHVHAHAASECAAHGHAPPGGDSGSGVSELVGLAVSAPGAGTKDKPEGGT